MSKRQGKAISQKERHGGGGYWGVELDDEINNYGILPG
jgi:hypothetical protein